MVREQRLIIFYFFLYYLIQDGIEQTKGGKKCVDKICDGKKINIVKGLPLIYEMDSTKLMVKKHYDDGDAGGNLLDSLVPDIDVPIMKPSKGAWVEKLDKECKMQNA